MHGLGLYEYKFKQDLVLAIRIHRYGSVAEVFAFIPGANLRVISCNSGKTKKMSKQ